MNRKNILLISILIPVVLFIFLLSPLNHLCKVIPEDITFYDIPTNNLNIREYNGVLRSEGTVNTKLKSLIGKLYDKGNNLISEQNFDYKNIELSLTERIAFNVKFKPVDKTSKNDWVSEIDHYEFIPVYSCSYIGFFK